MNIKTGGRRQGIGYGVVIFIFLLSAYTSAAMTEKQIHQRADAITAKLRCPVCQNLSVADSDSFMANQIKDKVKKMLIEGKTDAEIMSYFKSKYGDWVFLAPPKSGFNMAVWLLPFIGLAGGALLIIFSLRSMKAHSSDAQNYGVKESAPTPFSEEIKKELDKYDY